MFTLWWWHLWPLQTRRYEKYHFWIGENLHAQTSQGHLQGSLKWIGSYNGAAQRSNMGIKIKRILKIQRIFIVFSTEGQSTQRSIWGAFFSFLCDWTVKIRQKGGTMGMGEGMQEKGPSQDLTRPLCWASSRWAQWAPSQMHIYIIMVLRAMMHHRVHKRVQEEVVPTLCSIILIYSRPHLNSMFKN